MTRVDRIASNKPELDMVLPCIPSQFGLGIVWLVMDEFGLAWMEDNPKIFVHFEGR